MTVWVTTQPVFFISVVSKVYCCNCRNYSSGDWGNYCAIPDYDSADWYGKYRKNHSPEKLNKNNDCEHWKHKRGLIEWLNDLIN